MSPADREPEREEESPTALEDVAEQRESLEALIDTVQTLEQSGVLDLLAVIGTRDMERDEQLYEVFADEPANLRAVQNLSLLGGGLANANPNTVAALLDSMRDGGAVTAEELAHPPELGLLGILRQLRDPEVRRGLGTVFLLLKRIGSRSDAAAPEAGARPAPTGQDTGREP